MRVDASTDFPGKYTGVKTSFEGEGVAVSAFQYAARFYESLQDI